MGHVIVNPFFIHGRQKGPRRIEAVPNSIHGCVSWYPFEARKSTTWPTCWGRPLKAFDTYPGYASQLTLPTHATHWASPIPTHTSFVAETGHVQRSRPKQSRHKYVHIILIYIYTWTFLHAQNFCIFATNCFLGQLRVFFCLRPFFAQFGCYPQSPRIYRRKFPTNRRQFPTNRRTFPTAAQTNMTAGVFSP